MELLIGVEHNLRYLNGLEQLLDKRYPDGIDSLMLEMSLNTELLVSLGIFESYWELLAEHYRNRGANIIYGDKPIPQRLLDIATKSRGVAKSMAIAAVSDWGLLDAILTRTRDKFMVQTIQTQDPQVVIVGRGHSDYIKRKFPSVPYIVYIGHKHSSLFLDIDYRLPDEIIWANLPQQ